MAMCVARLAANALFPESLTTERLEMKRLTSDSVTLRELHGLFGEPEEGRNEELRHLMQEPYQTLNGTADFRDWLESAWNEGNVASYTIRPAEGEPDAGAFAGLTTLEVDWDRSAAELGVVLDQQFWNRGYSQERAKALCRVAFRQLGLEIVEITSSVDNDLAKSSIDSYINDIGGHYVGVLHNHVVDDNDERIDCHRYTITRQEYEAESNS